MPGDAQLQLLVPVGLGPTVDHLVLGSLLHPAGLAAGSRQLHLRALLPGLAASEVRPRTVAGTVSFPAGSLRTVERVMLGRSRTGTSQERACRS